MAFIDYFEWESLDQIDFRYFHVRMLDSKKYLESIDIDVLIETIYAYVFFEK